MNDSLQLRPHNRLESGSESKSQYNVRSAVNKPLYRFIRRKGDQFTAVLAFLQDERLARNRHPEYNNSLQSSLL
jgi:hypothetical protein